MKCKCIRGSFNPIIQIKKGSVLYTDNSDWMDEYGTPPKQYEIKVSSPHGEETFFVSTTQPTELPLSKDEVYCISFNNCGTLYETFIPILPTYHCKLETLIKEGKWEDETYELAQILSVMELECDKEKLQELYSTLKSKFSKTCCDGM